MTKLGSQKLHICPKGTKMGSINGHRIDYNGIGALRDQRHIPSKNLPKYPPGKNARVKRETGDWGYGGSLSLFLMAFIHPLPHLLSFSLMSRLILKQKKYMMVLQKRGNTLENQKKKKKIRRTIQHGSIKKSFLQ